MLGGTDTKMLNARRGWYKKAPLSQYIRPCWHEKAVSAENARRGWYKRSSSNSNTKELFPRKMLGGVGIEKAV